MEPGVFREVVESAMLLSTLLRVPRPGFPEVMLRSVARRGAELATIRTRSARTRKEHGTAARRVHAWMACMSAEKSFRSPRSAR